MKRHNLGLVTLCMIVASCSTTPILGGGPATCAGNQLSTPNLLGQVTFEAESSCISYGSAYNRRANGATNEKTLERASLIDWLETNIAADDAFLLDRFGRGTLMRCSSDTTLTDTKMTSNVMVGSGEDQRGIFLMMELPQNKCAASKEK